MNCEYVVSSVILKDRTRPTSNNSHTKINYTRKRRHLGRDVHVHPVGRSSDTCSAPVSTVQRSSNKRSATAQRRTLTRNRAPPGCNRVHVHTVGRSSDTYSAPLSTQFSAAATCTDEHTVQRSARSDQQQRNGVLCARPSRCCPCRARSSLGRFSMSLSSSSSSVPANPPVTPTKGGLTLAPAGLALHPPLPRLLSLSSGGPPPRFPRLCARTPPRRPHPQILGQPTGGSAGRNRRRRGSPGPPSGQVAGHRNGQAGRAPGRARVARELLLRANLRHGA